MSDVDSIRFLQDWKKSAKFTRDVPIDWKLNSVKDPHPNRFFDEFTRDNCWKFILEKTVEGHEIEEVEFDQPPGSKSYVMEIHIGANEPLLYVKLQVGRDKVIGRSFYT